MNFLEHKLLQIILYPLSLLYGMVIEIRNRCYDRGIFRTHRAEGCHVISVGNISAGGTGKTPVVKFLAEYLRHSGVKVAILSRGYGRKSKGTVVVSDGNRMLAQVSHTGDEPFLLAKQLPRVPVVVEADRYKGALFIQEKFNPRVILLDDGFQHRRLHRDLDIVLIDASCGFGNKRMLPAGFLREPIKSLQRASLIWLTRVDQTGHADAIMEDICAVTTCPVIKSAFVPHQLIQVATDKRHELNFLKGKKVSLFSGIANHASFARLISEMGATVLSHTKFRDHHPYTGKDIEAIFQRSRTVGADLFVTTEKDYVKINQFIGERKDFFYLTIAVQISEGLDKLKIINKRIFKNF